jgi:hypothetical protein
MAAVGSVTYTEEPPYIFGALKKIKMAWTASADTGAVSGTLTTGVYNGEIIRLVTVPGKAGDAPDADYDVTVLDEDGTDVLMGAGANRHTSNTEQVLASSLGCVANDKLELRVANAGNANKGTVYLYLR